MKDKIEKAIENLDYNKKLLEFRIDNQSKEIEELKKQIAVLQKENITILEECNRAYNEVNKSLKLIEELKVKYASYNY